MSASEGPPLGPPVEGPPARPPAPVRLEGRHINVAPFDPLRHAGDIHAATAAHPDLYTYLSLSPPADDAAARVAYGALAGRADPLLFALVDTDGRARGHASYMRIEPAHRVIEVGNILFTPSITGTTAATEAMYLMARHAFEDLGYRRYEWKCHALNAPSRRAALRLGFSFEGVFAKHMIIKGRSRDTAWFALLDEEWPRARAAFEAWLSADNFDGEGRQKRRLEEIRRTI